jgi:hypothetical protein
MLDAVDAGLDRTPHAVDAASVDRDSAAGRAGDPHDLAELCHRELRLKRVRALGHVAACAHDLDGIDPLLDELLREARDRLDAAGHPAEKVTVAAGRGDRPADRQYPGSRHQAGVNRVAKLERDATPRPEVANGGHSCQQGRAGVYHAGEREAQVAVFLELLEGDRAGAEGEMDVRVHEPRE